MRNDDRQQIMSALAMAGGIGLNLAAAVTVGLFGGRMIDNWLGTAPWLTVTGVVLGMVAGLWSTYKRIAGK